MLSSRISAALSAASWSSIIAPKTACSASLLQGVCRPAYGSVVEEAGGDTDVIPGWSLPGGVAQQRGRMVGHDHGDAAEAVHLIPERAYRLFGAEQALRRRPAHRQNDCRLDQLDLAVEVRQARRDFVVLRQAVLGRPAFHDVADEHLLARQLDGLEDLREQLPGPADERAPRLVFGASGTFPDDDEAGGGGSFARHGVGAALAHLALATGRDERRDVLEACRPLDWIGGEEIDRRWLEGDARRRRVGMRRCSSGLFDSRIPHLASRLLGENHRVSAE